MLGSLGGGGTGQESPHVPAVQLHVAELLLRMEACFSEGSCSHSWLVVLNLWGRLGECGTGGCELKPKAIAWLAGPQEVQPHCDLPDLQPAVCCVRCPVGALGEALGAVTLLPGVQAGLL